MYKKLFKKTFFFLISILIFTQSLLYAHHIQTTIPIDSWPPFRIIDDKKYTGIDFDLLDEVSKRLNLQLNYKKYPWARSLIYMESGKVDLMSGLAKRKEREKYITYTYPSYYTCSTVFYVKRGNKELIKTYNDLKEQLIGYVDKSAYFEPFDSDKTLNKRGITNEAKLIKMLAVGRIKVMIGTDCQVDYDIKRLGYKDKLEKAEYKPGNKVDLYIGISKKSPFIKDIDKINTTIQQILDEGKIEEFAKKYYE